MRVLVLADRDLVPFDIEQHRPAAARPRHRSRAAARRRSSRDGVAVNEIAQRFSPGEASNFLRDHFSALEQSLVGGTPDVRRQHDVLVS
jgi:hypothetical protein